MTREQRLIELYRYTGLNQKHFANRVGVSQQMVSDIFKGKKKAGEKVVFGIIEAFSYINPLWLLKGDGEMLTLGGKLRDIRLSSNLSVDAFAKIINEDYLLVQNIESGEINPTYEYVMKVKNNFEVKNFSGTFKIGKREYNLVDDVDQVIESSGHINFDTSEFKKMQDIIDNLTKENTELKEELIQSQKQIIQLLNKKPPGN